MNLDKTKDIQLIVVGAGDVARKLLSALEDTALHLKMQIHTFIDIVPEEKLYPEIRRIIKKGARYLLAPEAFEKFILPENAAAMVMTPNRSHLEYARKFVALGLKTSIEKPLVVDLDELDEFKKLSSRHPNFFYGMQAVADGMCVGLQLVAGSMAGNDPRRKFLSDDPSLGDDELAEFFISLGPLKKVEGFILEGEGERGTLEHHQWLLDGEQGGMIRDLAGHLFSPLLDTHLITGETSEEKIELGFHEENMALGEYRPLRSSDEAETYARMRGFFHSPVSTGQILFDFQVGKYAAGNKLSLQMQFERGRATLHYLPPTALVLENFSGKSLTIRLNDTVDHAGIALLDFQNFLLNGSDGHIERGIKIVEFNERMRRIGLAGISN